MYMYLYKNGINDRQRDNQLKLEMVQTYQGHIT